MLYQGEQAFVVNVPADIRVVFQVADGRATGFTLHQAGQTYPAGRIGQSFGARRTDPAGFARVQLVLAATLT